MNSKFMDIAIDEALKAKEENEVPVGAVIVKDGKIISRAHNLTRKEKCALAHAECLAIKKATEILGCERLTGCELYVTLEPCPMCAGAIINSRIDTLIFGAYDKKAGSADSVINLFNYPYNHKPTVYGGIKEKNCAEILSGFFEDLR